MARLEYNIAIQKEEKTMKGLSLEEYKNGISFFTGLVDSNNFSVEEKKSLLIAIFNMNVEVKNEDEFKELTNLRNDLVNIARDLDSAPTRR